MDWCITDWRTMVCHDSSYPFIILTGLKLTRYCLMGEPPSSCLIQLTFISFPGDCSLASSFGGFGSPKENTFIVREEQDLLEYSSSVLTQALNTYTVNTGDLAHTLKK